MQFGSGEGAESRTPEVGFEVLFVADKRRLYSDKQQSTAVARSRVSFCIMTERPERAAAWNATTCIVMLRENRKIGPCASDMGHSVVTSYRLELILALIILTCLQAVRHGEGGRSRVARHLAVRLTGIIIIFLFFSVFGFVFFFFFLVEPIVRGWRVVHQRFPDIVLDLFKGMRSELDTGFERCQPSLNPRPLVFAQRLSNTPPTYPFSRLLDVAPRPDVDIGRRATISHHEAAQL